MSRELTDAQIDALLRLVPLAEQLEKEAKYRAATRLVVDRWKGTIIWLATLIAAVLALTGHLRDGLKALIGWV